MILSEPYGFKIYVKIWMKEMSPRNSIKNILKNFAFIFIYKMLAVMPFKPCIFKLWAFELN